MRSVVALVEARPETIIEDYDRVIELARMGGLLEEGPVALAPQVWPGGWFPGAGSPPWQLDGVLTWLAKRQEISGAAAGGGKSTVVMPTSPAGGHAFAAGWAWADVLTRHGAESASELFRHRRTFRAEPALPALETALPGGLSLPAGLRDRAIILMPVPAVDSTQPLSGSLNLLRSLLAPDLRSATGESAGEILADVIRFASQAVPGLGVVMDAVLWQVGGQPGTHSPVARNILLAGRDPVAVDSVATRLAGRNPDLDPWLRQCRDQGLGAVREDDIRLVGRADLLDLDFGVSNRILDRRTGGWNRMPLAGFFRRKLKRSSLVKRHSLTPWGGLFEAYRAGGPPGD